MTLSLLRRLTVDRLPRTAHFNRYRFCGGTPSSGLLQIERVDTGSNWMVMREHGELSGNPIDGEQDFFHAFRLL